MQIELKDLLAGKATRIKNNDYFPTAAYVEPFLERMQKFTSDFRVQVRLPDQVTKTKDGNIDLEDITYNRVWIQAVLPEEYNFDNHQEVIGMIYGLDIRKPIVKFYKGGLNRACTNLCIFNPEMLSISELQPESAINYKPVLDIIEKTNDLKIWLQKLHDIEFVCEEQNINESLGKWIRASISNYYDTGFGKVKLATSTAIDAYKLLFETEDSNYYVGKDSSTDMFTIYNAFTDLISNDSGRDIMNKCEKIMLLKEILSID